MIYVFSQFFMATKLTNKNIKRILKEAKQICDNIENINKLTSDLIDAKRLIKLKNKELAEKDEIIKRKKNILWEYRHMFEKLSVLCKVSENRIRSKDINDEVAWISDEEDASDHATWWESAESDDD